MLSKIFKITKNREYQKAGANDIIELLAAPGNNPIYVMKWILEAVVYGIVAHEFIHLSGPTGSAKTSLLEALYKVPRNFKVVCESLGYDYLPLMLYPIEMASYETPGELYMRRALKDGTTYDEKSRIVLAVEKATEFCHKAHQLIWLRELGRVHSSSIQGGLLDLITKTDIILPDGTEVPGGNISWIADSNYQAEQDSNHTLVVLDDALKRRFSINITMDYLPAELEEIVLEHIVIKETDGNVDLELVRNIVMLGQIIRRYRVEGDLQSVTAPTIYGYLSFFRMVQAMPHVSIQQIALATLLGNANSEDKKVIPSVFNEVFGLHAMADEDLAIESNLF